MVEWFTLVQPRPFLRLLLVLGVGRGKGKGKDALGCLSNRIVSRCLP